MREIIFLFLASFYLANSAFAQTVGTLQNDPSSYQGYTFFSPFSGTKAYMVDNCGRLVNQWDRNHNPGLAAYFLDTGHMLRTYKPSPAGPFSSASNSGGLEFVDWNNNTVWQFEYNTPETISHHDAVAMPNGNFLLLTWQLVYEDQLVDMGRDPGRIASDGYMWSEKIIEVEPVGADGGNIVWEWNIYDHYIQDFDADKLNFGVIADHPELFNINLAELNSSNSHSTFDWNHFNAIDYNEALDQILISVRNSDEIWIIDHSTTTAEAATHSGGDYGKGGDILYRWGNASAYERGPVEDQQLFGQHGVHWIKEGLNDAGKIMIFNNGNGRPGPDYSTVEILVPPTDTDGHYIVPGMEPFGPEAPEWIYGDQPGEDFFSPYLSNAQRLENGNTLVNPGSTGIIFEIDENKNKVWEYVIPLWGDTPVNQGGNAFSNSTFRAYRFGPDFTGFAGIEIMTGETIEIGENPLACETTVSAKEADNQFSNITIYYNKADRSLKIDYPEALQFSVSLSDIAGRTFLLKKENEQRYHIDLPAMATGIYFVSFRLENGAVMTEKIVL